jgi:penicillin-binding protein 1C
MDRNQIRKIIFIAGLLLATGLFNRLEWLDPLQGTSFSKEIYDRNGHLLRLTLSDDDQYRIYRRFDQIDENLKKAVLLSEDRHFYHHWGVNPISLVRAVFSLKEDRPYGASTITMQMVRLRDKIYTKNFSGKIAQIAKATLAEFLYSKRQIFEAYLNLTPYGANIEGVGAASLIYFNKPSNHLSLPESLLLAVIPQNPVKRNLQDQTKSKAFEARDRLYQEWLEKDPSQSKLKMDLKIPMISQKISELPFLAPHFVNYVASQMPTGSRSAVKTTLDLRAQTLIEKKLQSYIKAKESIGIHNGAVLLVNKSRREIKAWVGSNDFFDSEIGGQIDAITTPRSPGSALKPFLYALALDEGLIHPQTVLYDTPSSFGIYDPENFDRTYKGPLSAEEALIQSRNVPAIYLASRLKKKSLYRLLDEGGVDLPQNEKYYGLAIALGSAEVTPLQLGGLYTALANQGKWSPLNWNLNSIEKKEKRILSGESSFMVLDMLKKNIRSESALLDEVSKEKIAVAWKTGTSYGFRDAWVAGVVGDDVLVVWLGNFDNASNPALIGREIAAPLYFEIIDLLKGKGLLKDSDWEMPMALKLKSADVCSLTGGFSRGACPHLKKAWFNPGISPIEECNVHREFLVSTRTGKRLCHVNQVSDARTEVYEFWPSDIVQLFVKFGLPYKKAPAFEDNCEETVSQAASPEIVSPKQDLIYSVRFEKQTGYEKIPLKAKVDQDIKKVFWFANQKPLGESTPQDTFLAELSPGNYEITLVDDHGQVMSRDLQIRLVQ